MNNYDVIVIGAGPGGYTCANDLAANGLKVAIIENDRIGGTCVNYGCLPTKYWLSAAKKWNSLDHLTTFGIKVPDGHIDFQKLKTNKAELSTKLNEAILNNLTSNQVEVIHGFAEVIDDHHVVVNDQTYHFNYLVLATGTSNRSLNLPGFATAQEKKLLLDSNQLLALERPVSSLVIIGGGAIGVEFAYFFATFGTKVTIIQDQPTLIPNFDQDAIQLTQELLTNMGVEIVVNAKVSQFDEKGLLHYQLNQHEHTIKAQRYLLSVGRKVNDQAYQKLNLTTNQFHRLVVNEQLQTSKSHIYALGDVISPMQLSNVSYIHSNIVVHSILNRPWAPINYQAVPYALYLSYELASVGLTEQQIVQKYAPNSYYKLVLPASKMPRNHVEHQHETGFFKLFVDAHNYTILGAHLGLVDGSLIINELALAINKQLTIFDLAQTAHAHPTVGEAVYYAARALSHKIAQA